MSKAFTREDDIPDDVRPAPVPLLPPGARNSFTPEGHARLQAELTQLLEQRPVLVEGSLTDPELRRELGQLDQRLTYLERSLAAAEIVDAVAPDGIVRFGSTVSVRDALGEESRYRIVGVDEADFSRGEVSWRSPIASALLNARVGDRVPFRFPTGATELEIVRVE